MRTNRAIIAIVTLVSATLAGAPGAASSERPPPAEGAARIEELIAGRIAGAPVYCLDQRGIQSVEIVAGTALVYKKLGGTLYINTPSSGASNLRKDQILISMTYSGSLCNIDTLQLVNYASQINEGSVILQRFVPYPKPRS